MTTEEQLKTLCNSPGIPAHIKRHFAADCAERFMFAWCKRTGREPLPEWWGFMEAIRNFAEGRPTFEDLQEIRQVYLSADRSDSSSADNEAANWAADEATSWAAYAAANWAANRMAEREWQSQHFRDLIEKHERARSGLLGLLEKRNQQLLSATTPYRSEFEEVLFG